MIADKSAFRWCAVVLLLGMTVMFSIVHVNDTINKRGKGEALCGPCDLKLRYNELSCVHRGVNPFRIWNREVTDNQFHGLARPDLDGPGCFAIMDFANSVHAYTPWHTVFFWWYGWLPYEYVVALIFLFIGLALASVILFFKKHQPNSPSLLALYWSLLLFFYSVPIICIIETGNYGGLIAGLTALFLLADEKNTPSLPDSSGRL